MSDLLGYKTKKVTTYGRRGNRSNIIPIHNDLSPVRPTQVDSTSSPSPTTPFKRPPLMSKLSQGFGNIPQTVTPPPAKSKLSSKPEQALRLSVAASDSPRIIRRMHRPGRAVIPPSPSIYTVSPSPYKSTHSQIHCIEIPPSVPRPRRVGPSKLGQYRELSHSLTDGLDRLVLNSPSATPACARSPSSSPVWIPSPLPATQATPKLESVCTESDFHTFQDILGLAGTISSFVPTIAQSLPTIVKVGEATYSEVFSIKAMSGGDIVMKIIPITRSVVEEQKEGMPYRSPADDVAKEVEITKRMSGLKGGGFVNFFGAYIVRGKYHPYLLAEWDAFAEANRSENIRPSCFGARQEYAVIFLCDGGDDLECFHFAKKTGWVQAASVFWQVADALARAEQWTEFEHRDLHEGQILIDLCQTDPHCALNPLDPNSSGVRASIIDFGLSRLRANDHDRIVSTHIPDEVFQGQGEQWDVYRAIDTRVQGDWDGYHPITNLLWLQYILNYLLIRTPTLKRPKSTPTSAPSRTRSTARVISATRARPKSSSSDQDRSEAAYAQLVMAKEEMDGGLSTRSARRGGVTVGSAAQLIVWARSKGLVS